MLDILFFLPNDNFYPTGIGKFSQIIAKQIEFKTSLRNDHLYLNNTSKNKFLRKIFFIINYLFLGLFTNKIKRSRVFFSSSTRLPFLHNKEIFKVIFIHDLIYLKFPRTMKKKGFLIDFFTFPNAIRRASLILCPSYSTYKDIRENFPHHIHKVKITPLASPLEFANIASYDNNLPENYFLCVGTIEPRKNYKNILLAYSKLPENIKEKFSLIIVGKKGWGKVNLNKHIIELNIKKNIVFKNYVNDEYLNMLYKNAHCLIYVSIYEGFGLPILEANRFGVPVITSNISSMPEVAGEGALYVEPHSVRSLNEALIKIVDDTKLRINLSDKSKENYQRFSWSQTSWRILENLRGKLKFN